MAAPNSVNGDVDAAMAAAVCIGRFQPVHRGHLDLIAQALQMAPRCVIVIGSAHQPRTPKNPFTWQERAEMILAALPAADAQRVVCLPMRDYFDEARWAAAVQREVIAALGGKADSPGPKLALIGHFKDASSGYLRAFPDWQLIAAPRINDVDATPLRDAYFGAAGDGVTDAMASMSTQLPATSVAFLNSFAQQPAYTEITTEWRMLRDYHQAWKAAPYPPVFVTADVLLRCAGQVLLVQRGRAPGRGTWALPGGFLDGHETLYRAALRELHEETGLALPEATARAAFQCARVFDHPARSLRGRTVTHAHLFDLGDIDLPAVAAADDAMAAQWWPLDSLVRLEAEFFDDHFHILDVMLGLLPG